MIQADPTDPYIRVGQTFPQLDEDMARRVGTYGSEEDIKQGTFALLSAVSAA